MSSERAWVYTRYHKDYIAARNRQEFLEKRARVDGYEVVGSCIDRGHYPSRRDGYSRMMRDIKNGTVDVIYIARLGDISHSEWRLFSFFRKLSRSGVVAHMPNRSLRDYVSRYAFGWRIERLALKKKGALPWR